jgi:hypothetical protein
MSSLSLIPKDFLWFLSHNKLGNVDNLSRGRVCQSQFSVVIVMKMKALTICFLSVLLPKPFGAMLVSSWTLI